MGQTALFPIRIDEPAGKPGDFAQFPAELQDLLRRNERLACIGLLAAGIAHEINNPTGSALLAAETALALMDSPDSRPQVAACLRNIVTSMDRCGRIVRALLRYSREEAAIHFPSLAVQRPL